MNKTLLREVFLDNNMRLSGLCLRQVSAGAFAFYDELCCLFLMPWEILSKNIKYKNKL